MLLLFRVSKNVRYKRGGIKIFRQTFFVSAPKKIRREKKFVGEAFSVSLICDIEKLFCLRGLYQDFFRNFFVSHYQKTS